MHKLASDADSASSGATGTAAAVDEETMERARRQALRHAFEEFDSDNSGALSFDEVRVAYSDHWRFDVNL